MLAEALAGITADHPGLTVDADLRRGEARHLLVEASRRAQLVVVGGRGRGAFTGLLLGSVSQHVAHHARCPVVMVRGTGR